MKIDNRLGETFSAKIPLTLDKGELMPNLTVEIAAPGDYHNLNVHRHPALNLIRTDIIRNRLSNWIELTSRSSINTPVFFLVLKVRYGHATHFKKYSVFLDLPNANRPEKEATPPPSASVEDVRATEDTNQTSTPSTYLSLNDSLLTEEGITEAKPKIAFKPFDGWARTSSYGPTVYGDSIYTIADRLRIDERYTIRQVMVALFEKNRTMFAENNLNLPIDGTFLDTPLAREVEKHTYEQALAMIQEHDLRWKELKKQARYDAIAEAQRSRYSRRDPETTSTQ